jgi:uncharacterized protein (DUF4415 family)
MTKQSKPRRYADDAPLTAEELRTAKPAREADPKLVAAYERGELRHRGQRGPQKAPTKRPASIRLSPKVLDFFRDTGPGWQTRMNALLESFVDAAHR